MTNQDSTPVLHRDGTISYWSFSRQKWIGHTFYVPCEDLAVFSKFDRERVRRHLGPLAVA